MTPSLSKVARTVGFKRARRRLMADSPVRFTISASFAAPCESTKLIPSQSSTIPVSPRL